MGFVNNAVRSVFGRKGGGGYTAPPPPKPKLSHYSNPFLGFQTRQYELPDGNIQTVASRIYSSPQEEQVEKSLKNKLYETYQYITAHDILGRMEDLTKADQDYISELNRIGNESIDELNKIGGFDNLKNTLDYLERYTTDNINSAYDRQSDILETRLSAQGLKNSTFADRQRQLLESSRHDTLNDNAYKMKLYGNQYAQNDLATKMGYYEVGEEARNKQREEAQRDYENKLGEVFNPVMRAQAYGDIVKEPLRYQQQLMMSSNPTGQALTASQIRGNQELSAYNALTGRMQAENDARSRLTWGQRLFGESFFKPLGGYFAEITGDKIDDLLGRKKKIWP